MLTSDFTNTEKKLEHIKSNLLVYEASADTALLDRAYKLAAAAYDGKKTLGGVPLLSHFVEVALVLTEYSMDSTTIASAMIRDVIRFGVEEKAIRKDLGSQVTDLAKLLDNLGVIRFSSDEEEQGRQLRQMFIAMARDVRVIMIELASHLVFMRYVGDSTEKQLEEYARKSLEIFSPLAHRMGVSKLKSELEDLCFKVLNPVEYQRLSRQAGKTKARREEAIQKVIEQMKGIFRERGLQVHITGRTKHLYSTYGKMMRLGKNFHELFDLSAVRVITNTVEECYATLAILHSTWTPVHEEFDDYIVAPKSNGYKSIHTVVIASNGQPVEVQIRTWEMHMAAEYGVAAHWRYKETVGGGKTDEDELVTWIKGMSSGKDDAESATERLQDVVIDSMDEKVFSLTPRGRIIKLPAGSTPIDFAYRVHTVVGHRCNGARVNGRIVPLDYKLRNGDVVDIITKKAPRPSRDWMQMVVSASARSKIKTWFRNEDREENISHGSSAFYRELDKQGLKRKDLLDEIGLDDLLKTYNYKTEEDLFAGIGCGDVNIEGAVQRIRTAYRTLLADESPDEVPEKMRHAKKPQKKKQDIVAEGLSGVMVGFAKCCLPVPGDSITGFVTKTRGISVHRKQCPNIKDSVEAGERVVKVQWGDHAGNQYYSDVTINSLNRVGLLKDVMAVISEAGINVASMKTRSLPNSTGLISLRLEVPGLERLDYVVARLRSIEDILFVERKI